MQPADRPAFLRNLVALSELYGKSLSPAAQVLYVEALQEFGLDPLLQAIRTCVQTCRFMPVPADIRKLVVGDTSDAAEVAWQAFKTTARAVGGYQSPTFEDGALGATLLAVFGTWEAACAADLSPEMWIAKRREFERTYRVMRDRQLGPMTLDGFCRRTNHALGYDVDAPLNARLLGDGMPSRGRIADASDAMREQWRRNVTQAIEAHGAGTVETPVAETPAMTPLWQVAAETPQIRSVRESLQSRLARREDGARSVAALSTKDSERSQEIE